MESTQSYLNLLSEKQAAKRLGIAGITLLCAREAGRSVLSHQDPSSLLRGTSDEFLNNCERNSKRIQANERERLSTAPRKENVSSGRVRAASGGSGSKQSGSRKKEQASLPFAVRR